MFVIFSCTELKFNFYETFVWLISEGISTFCSILVNPKLLDVKDLSCLNALENLATTTQLVMVFCYQNCSDLL